MCSNWPYVPLDEVGTLVPYDMSIFDHFAFHVVPWIANINVNIIIIIIIMPLASIFLPTLSLNQPKKNQKTNHQNTIIQETKLTLISEVLPVRPTQCCWRSKVIRFNEFFWGGSSYPHPTPPPPPKKKKKQAS